jgi:hypothetical protein
MANPGPQQGRRNPYASPNAIEPNPPETLTGKCTVHLTNGDDIAVANIGGYEVTDNGTLAVHGPGNAALAAFAAGQWSYLTITTEQKDA